jgi:hypothetical protein
MGPPLHPVTPQSVLVAGGRPRVFRLLHFLLIVGLVALLASVYLSQLRHGPLNLGGDSLEYIRLATTLATTSRLPPTRFPPLYLHFLAELIARGAASSFSVILINTVALAVGLSAFYFILTGCFRFSRCLAFYTCLLAASSQLVIQFTACCSPEILYFAASSLGILLLGRAMRAKSYWLLALALLFCGLSIGLRAIGITLIPMVAVAVYRHLLPAGIFKRRPAFLIVTVIVCLLLGARIATSDYAIKDTRNLVNENGGLRAVFEHLPYWRSVELGQIFSNLSVQEAPFYRWDIVAAGALGAALCAAAIWRERKENVVVLYPACYAALLFCWPYLQPEGNSFGTGALRLWVPLIPYLLALVICKLREIKRPRLRKGLVAGFIAWGLVMGLYWSLRPKSDDYGTANRYYRSLPAHQRDVLTPFLTNEARRAP